MAWELHSEIQCIMGNGHMGSALDRMTDGQTRLKTLPSRNFVDGRLKCYKYVRQKFPNNMDLHASSYAKPNKKGILQQILLIPN